jgi:hypothetical protein
MPLPLTRHLSTSVTAPAEDRPLRVSSNLKLNSPRRFASSLIANQASGSLPRACHPGHAQSACGQLRPDVPAAVYGQTQYLRFSHRPIVCAFRTLALVPMRRFAPPRPARYLHPIVQRHQ